MQKKMHGHVGSEWNVILKRTVLVVAERCSPKKDSFVVAEESWAEKDSFVFVGECFPVKGSY